MSANTATVNRWHAHADPRLRNSGDTIDGHQARVCDLCLSLAACIGWPLHGSDLPRAALHHDEAERVVGDIPGPAKVRFPELAFAYAQAERVIMADRGIAPFDLTIEESRILSICDALDAVQWAMKCAADGPLLDADRAAIRRHAMALDPLAMEWVERQLAATPAEFEGVPV